jgi:hypothetical protein
MGTYSLSPVPPAPLTWRRALRGAAPWVLPAIAVVWALGELSTAVFNLTVGRDHEFRAEIWYSSLDYGRKALLAPVLYVSATIALWWAAGFVVRLVRFLPVCDRVLGALERWIGAIAARLKLDEAKSLGQAATAVAVAVIGGLVWAFRDLLQACATELPNARSEAVGLLATGHLGVIYRYGLVTVLLMLGVATVKIVRMSDRSRAGRLASLAPVLVTALVAVLLVQFPYRLLFNRKAPMVSVRGEGCYVLGQNGNRVQVFCPARPEDRTEVVELSKDVRLLDQSGELFDPW